MPNVCPIGTEIQTLIFPASKFPTRNMARAWAAEHGFGGAYVDVKENTLRIRQHPPSRYKPDSFRTIPLGKSGVQAVIGCPKGISRAGGSGKRGQVPIGSGLQERVKRLVKGN